MRTKLGPVALEGSLWGPQFDNYIYGALTGLFCDDDGNCQSTQDDDHDLKQLFYRQANANFWGLEGKASAPLWESDNGTLSANMLADYVRATFSAGLGNVPRIQPFRVGGGFSWDSQAFNVSFLVLGVGAQNEVGAFDPPTDGYTDVSFEARWRPWSEHSNFEIALIGHNLADEVERNSVALNKADVIMPGRDIRVVLRYAL